MAYVELKETRNCKNFGGVKMNELQSLLTQEKLEAFHAGLMQDAYLYFGAHANGEGTRFVLWVPDVSHVAVACTNPENMEEEERNRVQNWLNSFQYMYQQYTDLAGMQK